METPLGRRVSICILFIICSTATSYLTNIISHKNDLIPGFS